MTLCRDGRVAHRHEHTRVADGTNMNLVFDGFVHDAVRFGDDLAEPVCIGWKGFENGRGQGPAKRTFYRLFAISRFALCLATLLLRPWNIAILTHECGWDSCLSAFVESVRYYGKPRLGIKKSAFATAKS